MFKLKKFRSVSFPDLKFVPKEDIRVQELDFVVSKLGYFVRAETLAEWPDNIKRHLEAVSTDSASH